MQSIIIDMVVHGNFKVDYVAMSMLSAASAALGNTYRIHVKQDWDTNAALYIILVGRPGMGKTPPLQLAYKPIREYERKLFDKFCYELDLYEAACATKESGSKEMKKPILKRVTLDDFTLEALVLEHYNNLRGIAILPIQTGMGKIPCLNAYFPSGADATWRIHVSRMTAHNV